MKVTYATKVGTVPKQTHVNQWWDDDANEVKSAINENDRVIEGMYVYNATGGATAWAIGHKFSGWIGDRFVAGKIIGSISAIATDIDDPAKVSLAYDGSI